MTFQIKKFNFTSSERIFIFLWTLYSAFYYILSASEVGFTFNVSGIYRALTYLIIFILLIVIIFIERYTPRKLFLYFVSFALVIIIEYSISDRSMLVYTLFIILAQEIDINKLIRYDMYLKTILFFIIVSFCALGITNNYTAIINGTYKQAIGFSHPNITTCFVLTILVEYMCVHFKEMRWYRWLIIMGIWLAVMEICGGRSSGYTFVVIFLLYILANIYEKIFYMKITKLAFFAITPLMAIFSFTVVWFYQHGNAFVLELNSLFTGRISSASRLLNSYNIKLFGQDIPFVSTRVAQRTGQQALILDNAYVRCAIYWGLILFIAILVLYSFLFWKLLKNKRVDLALLSLFFVLLGFGETYMLNVFYNLSFLCILSIKGLKKAENETLITQQNSCASRPGR